MKKLLKKFVKNNTYISACFYILQNVIIHLKRFFNNHKTNSGTTHKSFSLDESYTYITEVFSDYQKVAGKNEFHGKIAELGPGDSEGVALMFLAHGALHVDLADRFYSLRNFSKQQQIKQLLLSKYPSLHAVTDSNCVRHYGELASGERFFDYHKEYDFIISRSVLEHVDNPEIVLKKMFTSLAPGGMLIHKVDLRDHGMFTPFHHSLKFLEIHKRIYQWMTGGSGYPNRFLFHRYREVLCNLDPNTTFYVAGLHGIDSFDGFYTIDAIPGDLKDKSMAFVNEKRAKFSKEFEQVETQDLMVSSFFLVCQKTS